MASISNVESGDSSHLPIVDIVIPYYNSFEYLKNSIASVLGQTLTNFRLTIILVLTYNVLLITYGVALIKD
jgi:cellulose synthase/poly-beta-1,6-N-acetylglucosamine synthase-like glycosyltransferase